MSFRIEGATGSWEIVCGLEVHAQVATASKLFSGASTAFGGEANTHVAPLDAGMPGMLPVVNAKAIEMAVMTGLGLNARINRLSIFERKNYFYPDLPLGYQISQYQTPIVGEGVLAIDLEDGSRKDVRITRLHLEADAGKSIHDQLGDGTLIDLNRCGVALMEIVSEPDIGSPEEAVAYMRKLRSILRYLGTCDGDMEKGNLRCDANVSVRPAGSTELGTRCEIKNLNSMRFVARAIEHEAKRQVELIESGGTVVQETRLYDSVRGETRSMRGKEEAQDYRYFPDPDLLPVVLDEALIEDLRARLPELPDARKQRFESEFALSAYDAGVLTDERATADFFENVAAGRDAKIAANWVINDLYGALGRKGLSIEESPVCAERLGKLLDLIADGTISGKIAKDVFSSMMEDPADPLAIVEAKGLRQVSDTSAIEPVIDDIIAANPDQVASLQKNPKAIGWFVGQVMKASKGKANPKMVSDLLRAKLALPD
ncbi:MAG: Asp-tRNA(Asn)/Glu-tRNA(Gln) amidotransferase subunit GatB [Geminicoccaceae bacterium]|nr:Asp-tRNA(Asn)/Glu-tRNA(Gln) amidotransferase subunit GatB [Geminicoccaceae bacterium]